jgi:DtxR family Mn-dependent transcriptional regulator
MEERMKLTNIQEEYLRIIYILEKEKENIRITDIARNTKKTKPTVNYAMNTLKEEGLVEYKTYGNVILTENGRKIAEKILEAYYIVYLFLKEILKLDDEKAETEAIKMKATLDDDTLNKLAKYTHETLGLYSLDCGYDINNSKCLNCLRRNIKK